MSVSLDKNIYFSDLEYENRSLDDLKSEYKKVKGNVIRLQDDPGNPEYKENYDRLTGLLDKIERIVRG